MTHHVPRGINGWWHGASQCSLGLGALGSCSGPTPASYTSTRRRQAAFLQCLHTSLDPFHHVLGAWWCAHGAPGLARAPFSSRVLVPSAGIENKAQSAVMLPWGSNIPHALPIPCASRQVFRDLGVCTQALSSQRARCKAQ